MVTLSFMEEVALGSEGQAFFAGAARAGENGRQNDWSGQGAKAMCT